MAGFLIDGVAVATQGVEESAGVLRLETLDQALEDAQCPIDLIDVGPVNCFQVFLRQGASGAAVLIGAVGIGCEELVLEGRADLTESASGHEITGPAAGCPADEIAHAALPCLRVGALVPAGSVR